MTEALGGFAPATPLKKSQNLSMKQKMESDYTLPLVGHEAHALKPGCGKHLLKLAKKG
jgi:hypothetical protein